MRIDRRKSPSRLPPVFRPSPLTLETPSVPGGAGSRKGSGPGSTGARPGTGVESPEDRKFLERVYAYPVYVLARHQGLDPAAAARRTAAFLSGIFRSPKRHDIKPGLLQLQVYEWFMTGDAGTAPLPADAAALSEDEMWPALEGFYAAEFTKETDIEKLYRNAWRLAVMEEALASLARRYAAKGYSKIFESLLEGLEGPLRSPFYARVSCELGVPDSALRVAADQLRARYREVLRKCFLLAHGGHGEVVLEEELRPLLDG